MTQTCEAIYENGVFRPVGNVPSEIAEGQQVTLVVESYTPQDILGLAAQVYEGLSAEEIDEIEAIATDRRSFFGSDPH